MASPKDQYHPDLLDWDLPTPAPKIALQRRVPTAGPEPAHFHPSIEINFLRGCDLTYSFSDAEFEVPQGRFCVFWGAHPHRKLRAVGGGEMTNIYVALAEFLQWSLPSEFSNAVLAGSVVMTKQEMDGDMTLATRLADEAEQAGAEWQKLHCHEVQTRLLRMGMEGWDTIYQPQDGQAEKSVGGRSIQHFEVMLRFIATNFVGKLSVGDVAEAANVSERYAVALFHQILGKSIMQHVREIRIVHAKMLLVETERKIVSIAMDCGFASLSAFYKAFHDSVGMSPAAFRKSPRSQR